MSRRILAPLILLVAAACSIAAVFAVHRIETSGGPVSEPFASRFVDSQVHIRFTTRAAERITVTVRDRDGRVVRTLLDDSKIDGPETLTWDARDESGRVVPNGLYRVRITRAGDPRSYGPARPVMVDATPPKARVDRASYVDGELRGLVVVEPDVAIVVEGADGERLDELRTWVPKDGTVAGRTTRPVPEGHLVIRFAAPLEEAELDGLQLYAIDAARNRTELHANIARATGDA